MLIRHLKPIAPVEIDGVNGEGEALVTSLWGKKTPFRYGYQAPKCNLNLLSFGALVDQGFAIGYDTAPSDTFVVRGVDLRSLGGHAERDVVFHRGETSNTYEAQLCVCARTTHTAASARQLRRAMWPDGLETVAQHRTNYTARELWGADEAARVMRALHLVMPGELIRPLATVMRLQRGCYRASHPQRAGARYRTAQDVQCAGVTSATASWPRASLQWRSGALV
jgi:hypothetical protein